MLTDEEISKICDDYRNSTGRLMHTCKNFARSIERAVLAKTMPIPKQEPVGYADLSRVNDFDAPRLTRVKFTASQIPVYADPQPAQAAAIPECDCEKLQSRIRHLERLLMGL